MFKNNQGKLTGPFSASLFHHLGPYMGTLDTHFVLCTFRFFFFFRSAL